MVCCYQSLYLWEVNPTILTLICLGAKIVHEGRVGLDARWQNLQWLQITCRRHCWLELFSQVGLDSQEQIRSREQMKEHWDQGWANEGDAVQVWRKSRLGSNTGTQVGNRTLETKETTTQKHRNDRTKRICCSDRHISQAVWHQKVYRFDRYSFFVFKRERKKMDMYSVPVSGNEKQYLGNDQMKALSMSHRGEII